MKAARCGNHTCQAWARNRNAINAVIGTADDLIGTVPLVLTAKGMVTLTRVERQNLKGVVWHRDSPLISGDGASYKIYVDVQAV
jgi:hypothetical protein